MSVLAPFFKNDLRWLDEIFRDAQAANCSVLPVDIKETDKAFQIAMDLPGMDKDKISIDFQEGLLTISGARETKSEKNEGTYHRLERAEGSFSRSFRLGNAIDDKGIEAKYEDGVLKVQLPKKELAQKKKISIG